MEMYVQHQATFATTSMLEIGRRVDFTDVSMFGEGKSTDRCREWNCSCLVVYITAHSY